MWRRRLRVEGLLRILRGLHDTGREDGELVHAIVKALMVVWGVGCALVGAVGITSFWMEGYSLGRKQDTEKPT